MSKIRTSSTAILIVLLLILPSGASPVAGLQTGAGIKHSERRAKIGSVPAVLWREPGDIESRNLFYGCGSKEREPAGKLKFIGEKLNGVNPKFDVHDRENAKWGVKLGVEARPEVAAGRLVWAAGYFTNEDYYLPELNVKGLPPLSRGQNLIKQGRIYGVRMKRHNKDEKKIGYWKWNDNPFAGTRELNGLKIMMELINNTDLKPEHLVIYDIHGTEQRYFVTDLGGSFGRAGAHFYNRSKGLLKDYQSYPLIQKAGPEYLDFWYFKHIPRADAKWIGEVLARLSDDQIKDAFRAAGFPPQDIEGFTAKVRNKINELTSL